MLFGPTYPHHWAGLGQSHCCLILVNNCVEGLSVAAALEVCCFLDGANLRPF